MKFNLVNHLDSDGAMVYKVVGTVDISQELAIETNKALVRTPFRLHAAKDDDKDKANR